MAGSRSTTQRQKRVVGRHLRLGARGTGCGRVIGGTQRRAALASSERASRSAVSVLDTATAPGNPWQFAIGVCFIAPCVRHCHDLGFAQDLAACYYCAMAATDTASRCGWSAGRRARRGSRDDARGPSLQFVLGMGCARGARGATPRHAMLSAYRTVLYEPVVRESRETVA